MHSKDNDHAGFSTLFRWVTPLINLILYGHFWIAAAALAMTIQTRLLLTGHFSIGPLEGFVFCGTLTLYALHRLVALYLFPSDQAQGRYRILSDFRLHILLYAVAAGVFAAWFYFQLPAYLRWLLVAPSAIALAYVVPFLNGRRLRDLPYLKIFLIALAWAWITVAATARECGLLWTLPTGLMLVERCLFIFAITIPFDIRDLAQDHSTQVATLPGFLGIKLAKKVAWWSLFGMLLAVLSNTYIHTYNWPVCSALLISLLSSGYFIQQSHEQRHDYYFTGLLDGTMIIQLALVTAALMIG